MMYYCHFLRFLHFAWIQPAPDFQLSTFHTADVQQFMISTLVIPLIPTMYKVKIAVTQAVCGSRICEPLDLFNFFRFFFIFLIQILDLYTALELVLQSTNESWIHFYLRYVMKFKTWIRGGKREILC